MVYRPTARVLAVLKLLQSHGRMTGPELAHCLEVFQREGYRHVGDEAVSPPLADESVAASLPNVPDEEPMEGKISLV